jgi:hypothetical protein
MKLDFASLEVSCSWYLRDTGEMQWRRRGEAGEMQGRYMASLEVSCRGI